MGVNDAAEMLEAAQAECRRLEREVATLRAEKDSPHADAKYWRELQVAKADVSAFANALTLHKDKIESLTAERDRWHEATLRSYTGEAAALVVIEQVRAWNMLLNGTPRYRECDEILAQSPTDALAEHDQAVLEESDRDWASYFESFESHVGAPPLTTALVVQALRGPRPFGTAAAAAQVAK